MPIETSMYSQTPAVKLDPAGAVAAGNAMLQNRLLQSQVPLQINNEQLKNAQSQLQMVSDHLTPLIGLGDKVTADDVQRVAAQAVQNSGGAITPEHAQQFVQQIVSNPGGIPQALQMFHQRTLQGLAQAQAISGQPGTVDNGNALIQTNRSTYSGAVNAAPGSAANVPRQLGPGERVSGQAAFVNGQPGSVPVGERFDNFGNLKTGIPAAPTVGAGAAANMAPRTMAAAAPAAPAGPAGFMPTAAPLGVAGATEATAKASADQGNSLQTAAEAAPTRKAQLQQLEQLLGQTTTGPVAGALSSAGAAINQGLGTFGINARIPGVADKEEFQKVASQLQAAQAGALGGTDAAKALAGHTNPSLSFSTEGNRNIIQMLKGQEDAITAKNSAWQEWKKTHSADTYGAFQEHFNKGYEPRAFQFPYMSPEERTKLFKSMTPNERAKVKQAVIDAESKGWIKPHGE